MSDPVPEIRSESVRDPLCMKSNSPLSVIDPVMLVTGLVISAVVPELIVPPLVTVFVFVVWARTLAPPNMQITQKTTNPYLPKTGVCTRG